MTFDATSRLSFSGTSCQTMRTPSRAVAARFGVTGRPPSLIVPETGVTSPAMARISVVFPAPFSPASATSSPACTARSTPSSAVSAPKRTVSEETVSSGAAPMAPGCTLTVTVSILIGYPLTGTIARDWVAPHRILEGCRDLLRAG